MRTRFSVTDQAINGDGRRPDSMSPMAIQSFGTACQRQFENLRLIFRDFQGQNFIGITYLQATNLTGPRA